MKISNRNMFSGLWAILLIIICVGCTSSQRDAEYFNGKTITIIVPHGPGGMDTYARALAPYLQKYLPGSNVEVENVFENGTIDGRNQVYHASPDGLTLGFTTTAGTLLAEWAEQPSVQYKTSEFSFIGRINAEAYIMVASSVTGFSTLDDIIRAKEITMGFSGLGSDDYYVALITANILGYTVTPNTEYSSVSDAGLACVKGSVDAIQFSASSILPQIQAQTVVPIVSFSNNRVPDLPDVPTIFELVPADKQEIMQALVNIYALDRTLFAPPGLPPTRLAALRKALDQSIVDPDFLASMKVLGRPIDYLDGVETTNLLSDILTSEGQIKPIVLEISQH
jgi:tripartite-type tricarboxylate transporter receptor subunit TctC